MRQELEYRIRALHAEYAAKTSEAITQVTRDLVEQGNAAVAFEREATEQARRDVERYISVAGTAEEQLRHLQATLEDTRRQFEEKVRDLEADKLFQIGRVTELVRALDESIVNAVFCQNCNHDLKLS